MCNFQVSQAKKEIWLLFTETSTLGIRKYKVERAELDRRLEKISTKYGEITIKIASKNGKIIKF